MLDDTHPMGRKLIKIFMTSFMNDAVYLFKKQEQEVQFQHIFPSASKLNKFPLRVNHSFSYKMLDVSINE